MPEGCVDCDAPFFAFFGVYGASTYCWTLTCALGAVVDNEGDVGPKSDGEGEGERLDGLPPMKMEGVKLDGDDELLLDVVVVVVVGGVVGVEGVVGVGVAEEGEVGWIEGEDIECCL